MSGSLWQSCERSCGGEGGGGGGGDGGGRLDLQGLIVDGDGGPWDQGWVMMAPTVLRVGVMARMMVVVRGSGSERRWWWC